MKEEIKVIAKLVSKNKKQILFALFAILTIILDKDNSVLLNAAPLVVAGAKAAGTAASAAASAGGASAASGAAAASSAAASSASLGATSGANVGNVAKGASNAANGINGTKTIPSGTSTGNASYLNNTGASTPKNVNPSSSINANPLSNSTTPMGSDISKSELKDSSKSSIDKEKKRAKDNRLDNSINNAKKDEDEKDEDTEYNNATKELKKDASKTIFCCFIACFLMIVFAVPIIVMLLIYPTDSTISQLDCSIVDSETCKKVENASGGDASFLEKLKNLLTHGVFGSNMEVMLDKVEDINKEVFEETDLYMNIPLFLSTIAMDSENLYTALDEGNNPTITEAMLNRLEYGYDLAMKQFILVINYYNCTYVGNGQYQKVPAYGGAGGGIEAECGPSTVGMTLIEKHYEYDEAGYYNRVKEDTELLGNLFKNFDVDSSIDTMLSKMQNQYKLYNAIRDREHNEVSAGNVPSELLYDPSIMLDTPLKGSYSITSPYGTRTGLFAGNHNGIDVVASDKQIYAAGNGVVARTYKEKEGGNIIEIRHTTSDGTTYISQYAHLSQVLVSPGDTVTTGSVIAIMGDTGITSGVHLHFALWNEQTKERFNPKNLFMDATNYNSI